jgi:glycosyltransferase involved in cell wall biosynthesis
MHNIRLHLPAIPYTITRSEYSHDAFTGKVQIFSPMMRSRGFEVFHYGVETSQSGATQDIELFTKEEWTKLRIETLMWLEPKLSFEEATIKHNDPTVIPNHYSNWNTPLCVEFNKRFSIKLKENYRSTKTDIICIPLARTYEEGIKNIDGVKIEVGIGYSGSYLNFRIFESYSWLSYTLGKEHNDPNNYWFVIPYAFNITNFKLSLNPILLKVGFLGRLGSGKGCYIIVEIAKKFPNVQFILCGAGDPKPFLSQPNIIYKEPIHGNERSDYLGSCIAILCPTKYFEPFGCSAVEAQLCGTPVISSDWGGMTETVEQFKTGLRCHTLADYCKGIQMAIDNKFDRKYIRDRASNLYDMYNLAAKYEYVFKSVLDIYKPIKNGWYSPDTHINVLLNEECNRQRIYIFLVYYGTFPNYFQLYLDSLKINNDILTVFLITDIDISTYTIPENLILINMTKYNVKLRASKLIFDTYNVNVDANDLILTNYKLVDFKIVFPLMFDDILLKYNVTKTDYVGWGDCDIIYGKFSNFINFEENYDIIGGWHGHLTAIKNTTSFKNNFKTIPNYLKLIINNSTTFVTDEIAYREPLIKYIKDNNCKMFYTNAYFCDIVPPCYYDRFRVNHMDLSKNFFDVYNPTINITYLHFNNKKLIVKYDEKEEPKEVLYCHLQKRPMVKLFLNYTNEFYINEHTFSLTI